jgi:hypothetical protein
MDKQNISLIFFGTPSNREGFVSRRFGFLESSGFDLPKKYLDLDGEIVPTKPDAEVARVIKTGFKGRKMTIASTYRFINPNDIDYNRGAFFGCGIAVLGDLDINSAVAMTNVLAEVHGYMSRFMNFERFCFESNFDINSFPIKSFPSLERISINDVKNKFSSTTVESYYLQDQHGQFDLTNAIRIVNSDDGGLISTTQGIDIIIAEKPLTSFGRRLINIDTITKMPERISINGELVRLNSERDKISEEIRSYSNKINEFANNSESRKKELEDINKKINQGRFDLQEKRNDIKRAENRMNELIRQINDNGDVLNHAELYRKCMQRLAECKREEKKIDYRDDYLIASEDEFENRDGVIRRFLLNFDQLSASVLFLLFILFFIFFGALFYYVTPSSNQSPTTNSDPSPAIQTTHGKGEGGLGGRSEQQNSICPLLDYSNGKSDSYFNELHSKNVCVSKCVTRPPDEECKQCLTEKHKELNCSL